MSSAVNAVASSTQEAGPDATLPPGGRPSSAAQRQTQGRLAAFWRGLSSLFLLAAGVGAWWWLSTHHFIGGGDEQAPPAGPPAAVGAAAPVFSGESGAEFVSLSQATGNDSEIVLTTVVRRPIRDHLTVPGRLDYDARQLLDYASPVDGIVSRVFVKMRQRVEKGESLAEVSSPDVGTARDEVRRRQDNEAIEQKAADWAVEIADNVQYLVEKLESQPPLADIERQFKDRVLGSYRETIIGGYSKLLYVEKVNASTRSLSQEGVLSGRVVEERASNLEVAKANFTSACEQALFMTRQERDRARASLEQARRQVRISREHLRTLVGSTFSDDVEPTTVDSAVPLDPPDDVHDISALVMRTPFSGVVEDVFVVRGQRVGAGQKLFVVADTTTLWVRAQIHERQWTTVEVAAGQSVRVTVPGAAVHQTTAKVNHVGATVESDSRSVPLVAELANDDTHYKPGMFVWVDLPQGEIRDVVAVPESAVMRHEGKEFVFVPDGKDRYRRVDIETGIENGEYREVKAGLTAGQEVVSRGAFILKSELLLEGDEEPAAEAG